MVCDELKQDGDLFEARKYLSLPRPWLVIWLERKISDCRFIEDYTVFNHPILFSPGAEERLSHLAPDPAVLSLISILSNLEYPLKNAMSHAGSTKSGKDSIFPPENTFAIVCHNKDE